MAGQPDLDRARPADVAVQVALALQRGELVGNARRAGQADRLADLSHRRRVAPLLHRVPDDLEHLALAPGEHVVRVGLVRRLRDHDGDAALGLAAGPALRPYRYVRDFGCAVICGVVHRMNLRFHGSLLTDTSLALIFDFTKHLFDVSWKCRTVEVQRWHARCSEARGRRRARHRAFARPTRRRRPGSTGRTRNFDSDGRPGLPRAAALDYG
jgi:hypothetical protein